MIVALQDMNTLASVDIPQLKTSVELRRQRSYGVNKTMTHSAFVIVTSADNLVSCDFDTAHRLTVSFQSVQKTTILYVPNAQGSVARATDGNGSPIDHFDAANSGAVALQPIDTSTNSSALLRYL